MAEIKRFLFKMVQCDRTIYGFIRDTEENFFGRKYSLSISENRNYDLNVKNPIAYYNESNDSGWGFIGLLNRLEDSDNIQKDYGGIIYETKQLQNIFIRDIEFNLYEIIK